MLVRFSAAHRALSSALLSLVASASGCAKDTSSDLAPRMSSGANAGSEPTGEAGDGNAGAGTVAGGGDSSSGNEGGSGALPGAAGEGTGGSAGTAVNPPYVIEPGLEDKVELEVRYRPASTSEDVQPTIHVENKILTSVLFNQLEIRYYMTLDGELVTEPYEFNVVAQIPDPVKGSPVALADSTVVELVPIDPPVAGADHYIKITFTTDDSIFLRLTDVAELRLANYTNDEIVQSNDYSFAEVSELTVTETITVYRLGELVYGVEPE